MQEIKSERKNQEFNQRMNQELNRDNQTISDLTALDPIILGFNGRVIHQIWFGTIPNKSTARKAYEKLKLYRDSWSEKNPTWSRIEWNKKMCDQLIKLHFPEHTELYKHYKYEIQRCDMIRYLILYRYGGWYADMDYYCNRPLDEVHNEYKNDIYFVQTPNSTILHDDDHVSNSLMYSKPKHPYWRQVMLVLEKNQKTIYYYYSKHLAVMYTTGPAILNRIYSVHKYRYKVKSLPYKLFHPYGIQDKKLFLKSNKEVFTIHLGKGSWEEQDSKIFLFFFTEWKIVLLLLFIFIIAILVVKN